MVRKCQFRLTTSWLLLTTRISRDLVRVAPVPVAPSPLCPGLTPLFLSVFAERLVRLLVATRLHFLGSCHARHGTKATAIQLLFPWGTFPFTLPPPLYPPACCPFVGPVSVLASFGQNVWTSFLPDSNLRRKLWFVVERAILISCRRLLLLVLLVARFLLRGGVLRVVIAIVIVLVLWQLCILFRYLSHSLANAAQSFA